MIKDILDRFRKTDEPRRVVEQARTTVDSNPPIGRIRVYSDDKELSSERTFKQITEDDLYNQTVSGLVETMVLSNGTAARLLDDFVTFSTLDFELTCEDPRGQFLLDEFLMLLENKRNPFDYILRQLFSQIFLRGNYCFELIINDDGMLSNIAAVDPDLFEFQSREDAVDGQVWDLIQFDEDGQPIIIDSPLVYFAAINALPSKRKGTALIAPAMPALISSMLMLQDNRKAVANHAYTEQYWTEDIEPLIEAGYNEEQVEEISKRNREELAKVAGNRDKSKKAVVSGGMELKAAPPQVSQGMNFIAVVYDVNDREIWRGGLSTPLNLGSQQYQAESSAQTLNIRDAIRIESYQSDVEESLSDKFTMVLQELGITEPAVLRLKRNNIEVQKSLAAFYGMLIGLLDQLINRGIDGVTAVEVLNEIIGAELPPELSAIERIELEPANGPNGQ